MVNKIFDVFFVKKDGCKINTSLTILRQGGVNEKSDEFNILKKKKKEEFSTCLSVYFLGRKGLNLVERGYYYNNFRISARNLI